MASITDKAVKPFQPQIVKAIYKTKDKNNLTLTLYRIGEDQTGVHLQGAGTETFNIDVESYHFALQRHTDKFTLESVTFQYKERKLGNADEAYRTAHYKDGKLVKETRGLN
jgi:hypothetical protein